VRPIGYAVPRNINDMHSYILSVIDVLSKYLYLVPVKTNSGLSIPSAFRYLFHENDTRSPVCGRTEKGKEFLNKHFQDMLRDEGIQFQVCKNHDFNVRTQNVPTGRSETDCTDILNSRIPTAIYTFSGNLSRLTMTETSRPQTWCLRY